MNLWLIRHTRTAIGEGICYGSSDVALPETFLADARPLLQVVQIAPDTLVYSSPLQRCAQLSRAIVKHTREPLFDARLREMNFGDWELMPWAEVDRGELDRWARQPLDWRAPGGETVRELWARSCAFLEGLQAAGAGSACVVSHGGVLRMLCARLWRQPPERTLDMAIPFGSALHIGWDRDAHLLSAFGWNDGTLPLWMSRCASFNVKHPVNA